MAGLSDYAENLVLAWLLTNGTATRPTAWYVGLHLNSTPPTDASPSTGELAAATYGYNRQAVTFSTPSAGATSNSATLTFGPNTGTNWGTLGSVSVWDAATSGNCLAFGTLSSTVTIAVNDSLQISSTQLSVSID